MNLKRSLMKRKIRFQKWKDQVLFGIKPDLFLNRFKATLDDINATLPLIKVQSDQTVFVMNPDLPALAWGMKINQQGRALINYGEKVQRFDQGIVEGVWDDKLEQFNFKDSPYLFGSGLTVTDTAVTISPPSHFYEGLFLFHNKISGHSYFSNSLNYVLKENVALIEEDLEAIINQICDVNHEITAKGAFKLTTELYTSEKCTIHVFYYHNIVIDAQHCFVSAKRPDVPSYQNFKEYRLYLLEVLKRLNSNANSSIRDQPYPSLVTLSSGYDSSAVASLLVDVGPIEAVTIDVNIAGNDDSGMEVARHLGIECKPCSHPLAVEDKIANLGTFNYSEHFADATSEFLATVGHGDDIVFKAFDDYLDGKTVYTGHSGDDVWSFRCLEFIGIPVDIINAKSLSEYRLRKNFFHIPLPTIGAIYPFTLSKIMQESEMKPYWTQDKYNRPIPRRLVEEKGVPRGSFAKSKRSTNPYILNTAEHKLRAFYNVMERYSWKD